jgi:hypothetical protein
MKRIVTLAMLVVLAPAQAIAQGGINLGWTQCRPAGGLADRTYVCDESGATFALVGSFKPGAAYPNFISLSATVDVVALDGSLPDWWGACRSGAFSVPNVTGGVNPTFCPTPYATDGGNQNLILAPSIEFSAARARIRFAIARTVTLNLADQEYYGFRLVIDDSGTLACAGCTEPICVTLQNIVIETDPPTPPLDLSAPLVGKIVTWQGESAVACAITPVRTQTWGQIKALYR